MPSQRSLRLCEPSKQPNKGTPNLAWSNIYGEVKLQFIKERRAFEHDCNLLVAKLRDKKKQYLSRSVFYNFYNVFLQDEQNKK